MVEVAYKTRPKRTYTDKQRRGLVAAAMVNEQQKPETVERQKRIRLPALTFLSRRFGFELEGQNG